jgi:hypothetical protein
MADKPVFCLFLLGKLGALYSAGLHQYAAEINTLKGTTVAVRDYGYWHPFRSPRNSHTAICLEKSETHRIALFGHSMGATGISMIARDLAAAGVPVELVFSLDCSRFSTPVPLGSNVKNTVTFCDPSHLIGGVQQVKAPGYRGRWSAVTTRNISHVAYDDAEFLRVRAIGEVKLLLSTQKAAA